MATGTDAILVGAPVTATGGVTSAPAGTALPTDAATVLAVAFAKLGYVSEDGVTKTVDASDEKIRAWGGDVVRVVRQDHSVSYSFTFLESANASTLKAIYGEENVIVVSPTVSESGKITIKTKSTMVPRAVYTFEMKDAPATIREVVPLGQLTTSGDVQFVHSNVISYTVTIEAFPDTDGVKSYTYIDDGRKLP